MCKEKALKQEPIWKKILYLAFPLIFSNLLQQLYHTVDAIIVGQLLGSKALAAVGTSGYIILILIYLFMGVSVGASIAIAHAFGAGEHRRIYEMVHTAMGVAIFSGILLTVSGIWLAPDFLRWMNVGDEEVFSQGALYLQINFWGMLPLLVYNMASGILRAIGDTRTALICLAIASILNIMLDVCFIVEFQMEIAGAAMATVIAQLLSAILIVWRLSCGSESYRLYLARIRIYKESLVRILKIGVPIGMQSVLQCYSNVYVQSKFNLFGADVMAGVTAFGKVEGFIYMPIEGLALALSTLVGQSIGAQQRDQVKTLFRVCAQISSGVTVMLCVLLCIFARPVMELFTNEPEIIQYGSTMLYTVVPFYFIYGLNQMFSGVIRGAGEVKVPMVIVLVFMCMFRVVWNAFILEIWEDPFAIYLSYPLSWILTFLVFYWYYHKGKWLNEQGLFSKKLF